MNCCVCICKDVLDSPVLAGPLDLPSMQSPLPFFLVLAHFSVELTCDFIESHQFIDAIDACKQKRGQTSMKISTVLSAPLLLALWKVY